MTLSLKHSKAIDKADGQDPALLQPSDWNAQHVLKVAAKKLVGNTTDSEASAEEVALSDDFEMAGGVVSLATKLSNFEVVVADIDPDNPENARVLITTPTIAWDKSTPEQMKADVVDNSITLAKMEHGEGGEILFYNKTSSPIGSPGRLPVGDPGTVLTETGTNPAWKYSGAPHCVLIDQKDNGVEGGTFTQDGWRDRVINVQLFDPYHWVTFAGNIFTLPIGAWIIEWSCPARSCEMHQTRLLNNTDAAKPFVMGSSEYAPDSNNSQTRSVGITQVTHTVATGYKLQHYCTHTGTFGKAVGATGGATAKEIYTIVKIWRTGET